jgi:hypothetical protein
MHTDQRFGRLADLFGQLEQAYLDRDFPMAGVQVCDLIPHSIPRPRIRPQPSAGRDQVDHVSVKPSHRLVEGGEPGTSAPGELGQVSAAYLAMADDSLASSRTVTDRRPPAA